MTQVVAEKNCLKGTEWEYESHSGIHLLLRREHEPGIDTFKRALHNFKCTNSRYADCEFSHDDFRIEFILQTSSYPPPAAKWFIAFMQSQFPHLYQERSFPF